MHDSVLMSAMEQHRVDLYAWLERRDPKSLGDFMEALMRMKSAQKEFDQVVIDAETANVMASMCLMEMVRYMDHLERSIAGTEGDAP